MFALALAAALVQSQPADWHCRNELEIWCSGQGCNLAPPGETTPLEIRADPKGGFSVCAYSGCWEGKSRPKRIAGRLIWAGDNVPFSTAREGAMATDVTLIVFEADGVGFVRAGGLATPLVCARDVAGEE